MVAVGALEQDPVTLDPEACALAPRERRGAAPSRFDPMRNAIVLGGKTLLELGRGLGKVTPQIVGVSPVFLRHHGSPSCRSDAINLCRN